MKRIDWTRPLHTIPSHHRATTCVIKRVRVVGWWSPVSGSIITQVDSDGFAPAQNFNGVLRPRVRVVENVPAEAKDRLLLIRRPGGDWFLAGADRLGFAKPQALSEISAFEGVGACQLVVEVPTKS